MIRVDENLLTIAMSGFRDGFARRAVTICDARSGGRGVLSSTKTTTTMANAMVFYRKLSVLYAAVSLQ
jgi:hypothetical protein